MEWLAGLVFTVVVGDPIEATALTATRTIPNDTLQKCSPRRGISNSSQYRGKKTKVSRFRINRRTNPTPL